ncbi:acyl carrier protein [Streptomyces boncukensis]|uniref:Acyl carrier protein n=1 Tax=Streptomyces boncukensis TaxID=2711219 RepID=A0A6G4X0D5_9ACTN|nr:acyl carrier protein [Streptomyces boncukensis]NGO70350.1 acyl carrier protein [Streptomyces boncukensis]
MPEFTRTDLEKTIDACVGTQAAPPLDEHGLDLSFEELGLDSLAVFEVVTRLQDELGVTIADDEADVRKTPRELIDLVNGRTGRTGHPAKAEPLSGQSTTD